MCVCWSPPRGLEKRGTDRDAVWDMVLTGPNEPRISWGPGPPRKRIVLVASPMALKNSEISKHVHV